MEVPIDRGHVELSFDLCLKKFESEIMAWWQIENQHFCIVTALTKFFSKVTKMFYDESKEYSMLILKIYNTTRFDF